MPDANFANYRYFQQVRGNLRNSRKAPVLLVAVSFLNVNMIQIASEGAPVAEAGVLGDVMVGLSHELEIRGRSVEIPGESSA
jgi:hypothetical protein